MLLIHSLTIIQTSGLFSSKKRFQIIRGGMGRKTGSLEGRLSRQFRIHYPGQEQFSKLEINKPENQEEDAILKRLSGMLDQIQ